jgi:hypothetical protein
VQSAGVHQWHHKQHTQPTMVCIMQRVLETSLNKLLARTPNAIVKATSTVLDEAPLLGAVGTGKMVCTAGTNKKSRCIDRDSAPRHTLPLTCPLVSAMTRTPASGPSPLNWIYLTAAHTNAAGADTHEALHSCRDPVSIPGVPQCCDQCVENIHHVIHHTTHHTTDN